MFTTGTVCGRAPRRCPGGHRCACDKLQERVSEGVRVLAEAAVGRPECG